LQAELLDGNQLLGVAPEEELEQREAGDLRDLEIADVADPGPGAFHYGYTMDIPWIYPSPRRLHIKSTMGHAPQKR